MKALVTIAVAFLALAAVVWADPQGPTSIAVENGRQADRGTSSFPVVAQAGNVSRLDINDSRITTAWQGFYGNVSGSIVLDDAFNSTFFQWASADPQGEIFASNQSTVSWSNISCLNFTVAQPYGPNLSILERQYDIGEADSDGFNETYTTFFTGSFDVGEVEIDSSDNCAQTYPFQNNQTQSAQFENVLLTDNLSVIFTTLIDPGVGYNGNSYDFQLLVAENGTNNEQTTTYYLFVELT